MDELDNDRIAADGTTPRLRLHALQYAIAQRRGDTVLMSRYGDRMYAEQKRIELLRGGAYVSSAATARRNPAAHPALSWSDEEKAPLPPVGFD